MLVVNLFAGSGAGKSTTAAGVFHALKRQDINCELVTEFAKDLVWDESYKMLLDQLYVFAKQNHRIKRLEDKVDVVVTDSPIFLSLVYNTIYHKKDGAYGEHFNKFILETFDRYDNMNYFLTRRKIYNPIGRMQSEDEAKEIDNQVHDLLEAYRLPHYHIDYNAETVPTITNQILGRIGK